MAVVRDNYYNIWIGKFGRVDSKQRIPSWIRYFRILLVPITVPVPMYQLAYVCQYVHCHYLVFPAISGSFYTLSIMYNTLTFIIFKCIISNSLCRFPFMSIFSYHWYNSVGGFPGEILIKLGKTVKNVLLFLVHSIIVSMTIT